MLFICLLMRGPQVFEERPSYKLAPGRVIDRQAKAPWTGTCYCPMSVPPMMRVPPRIRMLVGWATVVKLWIDE